MREFADMYARAVYGADDGAKTPEYMYQIQNAANCDGIAYLFATPHAPPGINPFP